MKDLNRSLALVSTCVLVTLAPGALAQDWPQWRGANRDGKAAGFSAPSTWPKELTQKWKVTVGKGDASPALVGDKLYVFARQEGDEIILCLDAKTGKELWRDKYACEPSNEPMGRHPGPRSSPTVAQGKVVVYGVRGTLSCLDAANGKVLWRKEDPAWPRFFTSSSPVLAEGLCIAQLGGEEKGAVVAFDLATGDEKWRWSADGTAYASPLLATLGGVKQVVALTAKKVVGLGLADGKLLWETPFAPAGRAYNAATPILEDQTLIFAGSGRGTKAVKLEKTADGFAVKELWSNPDNAVQFNTPVLHGSQLFGLSQKGDLFCLDAQAGKTLWTAPLGTRDFGSVVDAGSVLMALGVPGELTVFEPNDKEFKKVASYKVATSDTYASPVPCAKGLYVKDQESLTLWTFD